MAPAKETECPKCGTSLSAPSERTLVKARYDELAGRTIDDSDDDDAATRRTREHGDGDEDDVPFVSEKRTAPHHVLPPIGRRATNPALGAAVPDETMPYQKAANGAAADTGPELGPPAADPIHPPPASPVPWTTRKAQLRTVQANAPTERAQAVRLETAPTPQVLARPDSGEGTDKVGGVKRDPLIGTMLGEYRVEERVGLGGMGIVYRAVQPLIGNSVAIKVLRPDIITDDNELQRFLGEARAVNSIRHRSIISIFGASDTPDGRKYLVMEYLEGESLEARLLREGRIPTADALPILEDVLSALAAAHAANVVHRDLKPANVFLVHQSDGRPWVKLLDFGLARSTNKQEVSRIAGTPDYISPEHARGRPPGPPADLYAFGVLAYHLLTGKLPFVGNTPMEVMEQHVHKPPPVPHEVDDSIPLAVSHLILRLLDKEPGSRPDAKTVKADLKAAAKELRSAATQVGRAPQNPNVSGDTVLRGPPTPIHEAPRPDPRLERRALVTDRARAGSWLAQNWPWLAGGVALVWLLTVALYLLLQRPPEPPLNTVPIAQPSGGPKSK